MEPTVPQFAWSLGAWLLLLAALIVAAIAFFARSPRWRPVSRLLTAAGIAVDLGLVVYRNALWKWACPIEYNFDSLLLFVVMLGAALLYLIALVRRRRPAPGVTPRRSAIDLLFLPVMVLMQLLAVGLFFGGFRHFNFTGLWPPLHLASLILGSLSAAVAAIAGAMYVLLDRQLRRKTPDGLLGSLPSLESLESLLHHAVQWAFLLLTVGIATGVMIVVADTVKMRATLSPVKVWLALITWAVYAFILMLRFLPRWQGRRASLLSIAGFVLLLATYVVAQWS